MRGLLGERFRFRGRTWTAIEVLVDEACVVLRGAPADRPIQLDRPLRRAGPLATVPLLSRDGEALSPELRDLLSALTPTARPGSGSGQQPLGPV